MNVKVRTFFTPQKFRQKGENDGTILSARRGGIFQNKKLKKYLTVKKFRKNNNIFVCCFIMFIMFKCLDPCNLLIFNELRREKGENDGRKARKGRK